MATTERRKKGEFSKLIVGLVVFMNIVFTSSVLYIFSKTATEPTALIGCWFGFTTGELWMLSSIKKTKEKNKIKSNGSSNTSSGSSDLTEMNHPQG